MFGRFYEESSGRRVFQVFFFENRNYNCQTAETNRIQRINSREKFRKICLKVSNFQSSASILFGIVEENISRGSRRQPGPNRVNKRTQLPVSSVGPVSEKRAQVHANCSRMQLSIYIKCWCIYKAKNSKNPEFCCLMKSVSGLNSCGKRQFNLDITDCGY